MNIRAASWGGSAGTIQDSWSTVDVTCNSKCGGFVGSNGGVISGSATSGDVVGAGTDDVGGFVGFNAGSISTSVAAGLVDGGAATNDVGGFVGELSPGGAISQSYATGNADGFFQVGGFAGFVGSTGPAITDCYSTGSATAANSGGGFAGGIVAGATVTRAYTSTDTVSGTTKGRFAGVNSGTCSNCFSNINAGTAGGYDGTSVSLTALKQQSTYTSFDFVSAPVWAIVENVSTPTLFSAAGPPNNAGTFRAP